MKDLKSYLFRLLLFLAVIGAGGVLFAILNAVIGIIFTESPVTETALSIISGIGSLICIVIVANLLNKPFNDFLGKKLQKRLNTNFI